MTLIVTVLHILVSLALIFVVLLQKGSGSDMGSSFGGSSMSVFGARGSGSFLGKITAVLATTFMLTSLALAVLGSQKSNYKSVMERESAGQSTPIAPAAPLLPGKSGLPPMAIPVPDAAPASVDPAAAKPEPAAATDKPAVPGKTGLLPTTPLAPVDGSTSEPTPTGDKEGKQP